MSTLDVDDAVGNFGPGSFQLANRIQFTYVIPEPAALSLLVLAPMALARRRRQA